MYKVRIRLLVELMDESHSQRRRFFDSYGSRLSEREGASLPCGIRFSCPCCGYPTLGDASQFGFCQICWWEDDGQDDVDADEIRGGPEL